uniref:Uncharacterized protein n=1 Tax=Oryza barthii TaxID=65489 RepID=A0A0D3F684_9ORYZ
MVGADAALLQELESRAHGSTPDKHMDFVGLLCCNTSLPNIYVASTSILEVEAVDKHYHQQKQDVSSRKQRKKIWIHNGMSRQTFAEINMCLHFQKKGNNK